MKGFLYWLNELSYSKEFAILLKSIGNLILIFALILSSSHHISQEDVTSGDKGIYIMLGLVCLFLVLTRGNRK